MNRLSQLQKGLSWLQTLEGDVKILEIKTLGKNTLNPLDIVIYKTSKQNMTKVN